MKSIDLLIFVEHVVRELDVAVALKVLAERQYGLTVAIESLPHGLQKALNKYQPRVVGLPHARFYADPKSGVRIVSDRWPAATIVDIAWEQVLGNWHKDYRRPQAAFVLQQVVHHAWGPDYRDYLLESGVDATQIHLNGNPSLTYYRPPYSGYFPDRYALAELTGLDPNRKWLFFPENYFWAFLTDQQLEKRAKFGGQRDSLFAYREWSKQSIDTFVGWLGQFAQQHDDYELIFRPRPAIPLDRYQNVFNTQLGSTLPDRLHLIKEGSVKEWILASDIVGSSVSTTLLEACFADKPVFRVEPYPMDPLFGTDWLETVDCAKTYLEFEAMLQTPPALNETLFAYVKHTSAPTDDAIAGLTTLLADVVAKTPVSVAADSQTIAAKPTRKPPKVVKRVRNAIRRRRVRLLNYLARYFPYIQVQMARYANDMFTKQDVNARAAQFLQAIEGASYDK